MPPDDVEACARKLRRFAERSCRGESPLYEHLCSRAADDNQLLEIVLATPEGQPNANLFLGAIHCLLLSGAEHELRLLHWAGGKARSEHLANVDHHGRWIEWLAEHAD